MRIVRGDRIGRTAELVVGCSAVIFAEDRKQVLLTRRADNGRWCVPSGRMEAGETIEEACTREILEETGLRTHLVRLVGVYSDPNAITEYTDGNRYQVVGISFIAEITSGETGLSDETTDIGFFPISRLDEMDVIESHRARIADAVNGQDQAYFRGGDDFGSE